MEVASRLGCSSGLGDPYSILYCLLDLERFHRNRGLFSRFKVRYLWVEKWSERDLPLFPISALRVTSCSSPGSVLGGHTAQRLEILSLAESSSWEVPGGFPPYQGCPGPDQHADSEGSLCSFAVTPYLLQQTEQGHSRETVRGEQE